MSSDQYAWNCAACGRRVPLNVDTCRCGQGLAEIGSGLVGNPDVSAPHREAASLPLRCARLACGYRHGLEWPGLRHRSFAAAFLVVLVLVFGATLALSSREPIPTVGHVRLVARLDEFTRSRPAQTTNSIPAFLALPGLLGALPGSDASETTDADPWSDPAQRTSDIILPVAAAELAKGFCTPTLSLLIRQRFPGAYDDVANEELEKRALEKYPEYEDDLCVLPAWIAAAPGHIVKYQITPLAVAGHWTGRVLWSVFSTLVFAFAAANLFYRVIVPLALAP